MERMAAVVDQQNAGDPLYEKIGGQFQNLQGFTKLLATWCSKAKSNPAVTPSLCCVRGV
jgi:malate synthase